MAKKTKFLTCTHPFYFYNDFGKEYEIRAKVLPATEYVEPVLTPRHLRQSIKLKGRGNSATCAGSVCIIQNAGEFPHIFLVCICPR